MFVLGPEGNVVNLICNECGRHLGTLHGMSEIDAMWPLLRVCGWEGGPAPQGPHACPRCAEGREPGTAQPPIALEPTDPSRPCCAHIEVLSDATLVVVSGDLIEHRLDSVRECLTAAVAMDRDVIVDLAGVDVIDSSGLGLLIRAHRDARSHQRVLCFAAPSRFVRIVLHTMRLATAILTFDDSRFARIWLASQRMVASLPVPQTMPMAAGM